MKNILLTIIMILSIENKVFRKLIKKTDIPDEFENFLTDKKGICVYMIFDDDEHVQ